MSKNLVIVESPAKAKTIKKYLGKDFDILASYGHVRDLVPKEGAVDPEHDFAMKYQLIDKNERHVDAIAKAAAKADALYLATDPDREGEAISWHLYDILQQRELLGDKPVRRVVFHEITERAILDAVAHPRDLSLDLVNAQQARRALDYLVGFNLSPLLWKKIRPGLSAGRVQSPALRMIVEREEEIERFLTREYWTLEADAAKLTQPFTARLVEYGGAKLSQFDITDAERAHAIEQALRAAAQTQLAEAGTPVPTTDAIGQLQVTKVQRKQGPAQAAQAQSRRTLYDFDPATGSLAQTRFLDSAHHAGRPAVVRGDRYRPRGDRADHLHAHRFGQSGSGCNPRDSGFDRRALRRPQRAPRPQRAHRSPAVQDQSQERPRGARGDSSDRSGGDAGVDSCPAQRRSAHALRIDLEAYRSLPDDFGYAGYGCSGFNLRRR